MESSGWAGAVLTGRASAPTAGTLTVQCDKNTGPAGITTHHPRLQRGLDPEDKAERVRHYVENLRHEVAIIAQACGVADPRRLQREHGRIVVGPGRSEPLSALYRREGTLEV